MIYRAGMLRRIRGILRLALLGFLFGCASQEADVTRRFNERLGIYGDRVIEVYVRGLIAMANADYKLATIRFSGKAELLAKVLAADFSNKWGEAAVARP